MNRTPHILVLDDDDQALGILTRALSRDGYVVTATTSGDNALSMLETQAFDLLLLDLSMPRPDGFEILKWARDHNPELKIVAVSGFLEGALLEAASLSGAAATLPKPISPERLRNTVRAVLESDIQDGGQ